MGSSPRLTAGVRVDRYVVAVLCATVAIAMTTVGVIRAPSAAQAASTIGFTYDVTIRNDNSGMCLALPNGNTTRGTALIQWPCNGGAEQYWEVDEYTGDTWTEIRSYKDPSKCVAVPNASQASGARLIIWDCHNSVEQLFELYRVPGYGIRITNLNSGRVMAVAGASRSAGAPVIQWLWEGTSHWEQQWELS